MKRIEVNIGDKYGRLTVIGDAPSLKTPSGQLKRKVRCVCECGVEKDYLLDLIRRGHTKSCGCFSTEDRFGRLTTHGKSNSNIYKIHSSMIARCYNPNNPNFYRYGGRGISVCDEWRNNFEAYYDWVIKNGYKKGLSVDRIDNNGDYEPSNCRIATQKEQSNNTSRNVLITINGETKTLSQWSEIYGVNASSVCHRIFKQGIAPLQALTIERGYPYKGRIMSFASICRENNINYGLFHQRIYKLGWSMKRALTTPVRKSKKSCV